MIRTSRPYQGCTGNVIRTVRPVLQPRRSVVCLHLWMATSETRPHLDQGDSRHAPPL